MRVAMGVGGRVVVTCEWFSYVMGWRSIAVSVV